MKISVIIPTYKPQSYIWECLDSLISQTLASDIFEIIIVLNGCSDPWLTEIKEWINKNESHRIILIHALEGGVSNARNLGIEHAKGEYIAFIDDDDYVSKDYLRSLLLKASDNSIVLSDSLSFEDGSNVVDFNYSMHKTYMKAKEYPKANLKVIRHLLNGPCMKLISREVIGNIRFNKRFRNGEDSLFIYEVTRNVKNFKVADNGAIYYRRFRENSAITRKDTITYTWGNALRLSYAHFKVFVSHISQYQLMYSLSRMLAPFKGALIKTVNTLRGSYN